MWHVITNSFSNLNGCHRSYTWLVTWFLIHARIKVNRANKRGAIMLSFHTHCCWIRIIFIYIWIKKCLYRLSSTEVSVKMLHVITTIAYGKYITVFSLTTWRYDDLETLSALLDFCVGIHRRRVINIFENLIVHQRTTCCPSLKWMKQINNYDLNKIYWEMWLFSSWPLGNLRMQILLPTLLFRLIWPMELLNHACGESLSRQTRWRW